MCFRIDRRALTGFSVLLGRRGVGTSTWVISFLTQQGWGCYLGILRAQLAQYLTQYLLIRYTPAEYLGPVLAPRAQRETRPLEAVLQLKGWSTLLPRGGCHLLELCLRYCVCRTGTWLGVLVHKSGRKLKVDWQNCHPKSPGLGTFPGMCGQTDLTKLSPPAAALNLGSVGCG